MPLEVQHNTHEFFPVFVLGHSTDALGGKRDECTHIIPALNFRQIQRLGKIADSQIYGNVLRAEYTSTCSQISSLRRVSMSPRAFQNPFNVSSATSIAPTARQNSICSSVRGITGSSVLSNRGVQCVHHRRLLSFAPEKPRDAIVLAGTKLSLENSVLFASCYGRSKPPANLPSLQRLTSELRNDGSEASPNRLSRSSSRCSTKFSANRQNSISGEAA